MVPSASEYLIASNKNWCTFARNDWCTMPRNGWCSMGRNIQVVWRLDRLGRSLKHIIDLVLNLSDQGIIITGLTDGVDTATINGRLFLNIMASLAEYERELIRERTNAGLQSARARGRTGGRPKGFTKDTISKLLVMRSVYKDFDKTPEEIYKGLQLTRATFYRYAKILDSHTNEEIKKLQKK